MRNTNKETCSYCEKMLDFEEIKNPPRDEDGDIICDDCYNENCCYKCFLCDEYYKNPTKPEEIYFIIGQGHNIDPGLYQVIRFPYYLKYIGLGVVFYENSIKWIKDVEFSGNLIKKICPNCVKR